MLGYLNEVKFKVFGNEQTYLFLTVGAEGEQGHGTVGGAAAGPGWHAVLGGLAGALAASFSTQGGGQILPHLLPLSLLDVVLGGILQVGLHLRDHDINITTWESGFILLSSVAYATNQGLRITNKVHKRKKKSIMNFRNRCTGNIK